VGAVGARRAGPLGEDIYHAPGVEANDAEAGKFLRVPRHDGEIVLKVGGDDYDIRSVDSRSC